MFSTDTPTAADEIVRAGLAAADRRRRARDASRRVWQIAPWLAAGIAALALAARWLGWAAILPIAALLLGGTSLAGYLWISRRTRPVSDPVAAAIDADANLGGELRSASWFVRRERRDPWAEHHIATAAQRLQSVNWIDLYPPFRAPRAKLGTAALIAATAAIVATMPQGNSERLEAAGPRPAQAGPPASAAGPAAMLDPELQQLLNELLAAAANGTLPPAEALANNSEMRDLLSKLNRMSDKDLLDALKRALAQNPDMDAKSAAANLKTLSEQVNRSPDMMGGMSQELQEALEKLSDEMELAKPDEDGARAAAEEGASSDSQQGQMGQSGAPGGMEELSIQFSKEAEPAGGAAVVMMSSQDAAQPGGAPGAGVGGAGSQEAAASAAAIAAALKQETVEAAQDNAGRNVESEIRRKTEHGDATVAFTGGAAGTFDRSRAAAPPPVPEARRSGVQTYFIRKSQ